MTVADCPFLPDILYICVECIFSPKMCTMLITVLEIGDFSSTWPCLVVGMACASQPPFL